MTAMTSDAAEELTTVAIPKRKTRLGIATFQDLFKGRLQTDLLSLNLSFYPIFARYLCYHQAETYHSAGVAPSHASYRGPELLWATGRLMSPDCDFGASCLCFTAVI